MSPEDRTTKFFNWERPIRHASALGLKTNSATVNLGIVYFVTVWQKRTKDGRSDSAFGIQLVDSSGSGIWRSSGVKAGYLANPGVTFLDHALMHIASLGYKNVVVITKTLTAQLTRPISKTLSVKRLRGTVSKLGMSVCWRKPNSEIEAKRLNYVDRITYETSIPFTSCNLGDSSNNSQWRTDGSGSAGDSDGKTCRDIDSRRSG